MAKGDTKTNQYLDIAANGTRNDFPTSCCETRSQTLIREVGERIMDLEDEVERLENNPDVADIVATYADLQSYDTSQLTDKDVIRVLQDETHDGDSTYYRWSTSTNTWTYIGESKQYTDFVGTDGTTAGTAGLVPAPATTDTDKYLKSDGTWAEVQGGGGGTSNFNQLTNRPSYDNTTMTGGTSIPKVPTATSELTNDSGFITSSALPTVNDATLTITQNGTSKGTFTANDADDTTIALTDTTYSDFTGTDGSSAGTAGLVPAPATTDAGKFLKADGTWDTAGGGGPTVVQTTGTSTTDVMSQNAVTSMVFADPSEKANIRIGNTGSMTGSADYTVAIGKLAVADAATAASLGYYAKARGIGAIALGREAQTTIGNRGSIALGSYSNATQAGEMNIGSSATAHGYNNSNYRLLTGLYDGQSEHDAATYGQVISYSAINGAGAPTTATEGKYVGQLYYDTTNEAMYFLKTIDTTTTPSTYTWEALGGGGGGPTVVQTPGTSTTDVMSQNAVTSMIFADPATMQKIKIGAGASTNEGTHAVEIGEQSSAIGDYSIALGYEATVSPGATYGVSIGGGSVSKANGIAINGGAHGNRAIAIGGSTYVNGENSIGLGVGATTSTKGVMSIETTNYSSTAGYNNSQYRLLTGVYDGQSAHDAVTVSQVNSVIDAINTALSTNIPHIGA